MVVSFLFQLFSGKKLAQIKVASKSSFLFIPQDLKHFTFFKEISSVQNKVAIFAKSRVSEGVDLYMFHEGFFTLNLLAPK